ncbi:FecR family protein [Larkinella insperata]|uniref:FecR family protein n=1 Tax=Larkinella insperata TaxID=332158 RepID=A0ABW3PZH7_9BACT|nr:FecR domain-containing protein [Larkinella insperata]
MDELITKARFFDYFSGKATPLQKKSIETWLADPRNRERYYQWLHEWEMTNPQVVTNWQAAFDTARHRMDQPDASDPADQPASIHWWHQRFFLTGVLAASVLLLLSVGVWLFSDVIRYKTLETRFGETQRSILPDGSEVVLNANSRLRYPRFRFATDRRVELTGEADFSVRHLPSHQRFVVLTGKGLTVQVLGTQFTVLSRGERTRVVLRSGKVELSMAKQANRPALVMKPGDWVTLDAQGKLAVRQTAHPEHVAAWKHHRFVFDRTSLQDIAQLLQDNYGLTIAIEGDELATRTISGAFPAQDANELIKLVAEILQINYFRDNTSVTFTN